jgi:LacI family transcriptional regulator
MKERIPSSFKVTITDVARESGVSPATVSLVLRDRPGISQATRERVLEYAAALGYMQTPLKVNGRSAIQNLALILKVRPNDAPQTNQFYAPVVSGIESFCRTQNINLFYAQLPVDENNNPLESPRLLKEQATDGLLFVGIHINEAITRVLQNQPSPIVLVDAYSDDNGFDAVVTDNEAGAFQAVSYLIEEGHRDIVMFGGVAHAFPSIEERRQGYLRAMAHHGLTPRFVDCYHNIEGAYEAALSFLPEMEKTTAVFCANDEVAISVMRVAQSLGIGIPQDLSVVGFDNIQLAQLVSPLLTTMRVDKMGMGRLAAQLLVNRIQHPEAGYVKTVIQPSLVRRESVAAIRD